MKPTQPMDMDSPGPSRVRSHPQLRATAPIPFTQPASYDDGGGFLSRLGGPHRQRYTTSREVDENASLPSPLSWASPKPKKSEAVDNWQLLREMVEEVTPTTSTLRSARSHSPLREIFNSAIATTRAKSIPRGRPDEDRITDQLSTSPPAMPGFESGCPDEPRGGGRGIEATIEGLSVAPERRPLLPRAVSATRVPKVVPPIGKFQPR